MQYGVLDGILEQRGDQSGKLVNASEEPSLRHQTLTTGTRVLVSVNTKEPPPWEQLFQRGLERSNDI